MKIIEVNENPFKVGMVFKNAREVADFLDLRDKHHTNVALNYLSHYCEYVRDQNHKITITKVLEHVKPFKVSGFKYEIGQTITVNTGSYKIIDRYIGQDQYKEGVKCTWYKCRCLVDGYEFELPEGRISFGIGCPVCGNRKLISGFRSLWITYPDVVKYLVHPEEAKNITPQSNKKVLCRCPECGTLKEIRVHNLVKYGFSCSYCSDGISYPNKFIRNFLVQLGINYIPEKSFDWSLSKIYDEYLPEYNLIIENHGGQHYEDVSGFNKSLLSQQQNDELKMNTAMKNGIAEYVLLDCRESSLEWIKKSIMDSSLPVILDFKESDIDWNKCHIFASTNQIVKNVCERWKTNKILGSIAKEFGIHQATVRHYLEIGTICGYCDFEKSNDLKNGRQYSSQWQTKPIYCITDNIYFYSKEDCERYYNSIGDEKFCGNSLYRWINSNKPYHNKLFKYVSKREYNNAKNKSFSDNNIIVYGDLYMERYVLKEELLNGKK